MRTQWNKFIESNQRIGVATVVRKKIILKRIKVIGVSIQMKTALKERTVIVLKREKKKRK